jgi:apolipoprotein N-acyltransferase
MRNMLALFGAALLTVVVAGWYLGWYKVRSQPASVPGQHNVNIAINTDKITSDLQKTEQSLQQMLEKKSEAEAKKAVGGLTLPSPSSPSTSNNSDSAPLFPLHGDKEQSPDLGSVKNHPLLRLGSHNRK